MPHMVSAWGRSMLCEFAAKQQMLSAQHVFSDAVTATHLAELDDLRAAIAAVLAGRIEGGRLRAVLRGGGEPAALAAAVGEFPRGIAAAAFGLAYLPVELPDWVATHLLGGSGLKSAAKAIDPRLSLSSRTRLFFADRLLADAGLRSLLSGTSALVVLREHGRHPGWCELAEISMRPRLVRLGESLRVLVRPGVLSSALAACLAGDFADAEAGLREALPGEGLPRLADLFAVSLMPTCETLDAVERLRGWRIASDAAEAELTASG